jgi:hypothetical protein
MDKTSLVQQAKSIQQLLSKDSDESCAEPSELILFDQFVEIYAQQFEY